MVGKYYLAEDLVNLFVKQVTERRANLPVDLNTDLVFKLTLLQLRD